MSESAIADREPGGKYNEAKLRREIIARSESNVWETARLEWYLEYVYREEYDPMTCLCDHHPIIEICVLRNKLNYNEALVGNVCVNKFLGISSSKLFAAIRRVVNDNSRALNEAMIDYSYDHGWINEWERDFYLDTWRKRKLSGRQQDKREQINEMVIQQVTNKLGSKQPTKTLQVQQPAELDELNIEEEDPNRVIVLHPAIKFFREQLAKEDTPLERDVI